MGDVWLVRHGQTEWSMSGRHTSTTDLALTADGESIAQTLAPRLAEASFELVLSSPRVRARRTAELAGFPAAEVDPDLVEWDYGDYEGVTTDEIRESVAQAAVGRTITPFRDKDFSAQQAEKIRALVARRTAELPPKDFVEMMRAAIREDEWMLYAHGAIMGLAGGFLHLWIFGAGG